MRTSYVKASPRTRQRAPTVLLLVEGDAQFGTMLADALSARHYRVRHAVSAAEANAIVDELRPALIVMDQMLPDGNGLILCADIKARTKAPIVICSGSRRKDDAALAFKLGADDFIAKPFSLDELQIRLDRATQRAAANSADGADRSSGVQQIGDLVIDRARREANVRDRILQLTPTEYRLLCEVARHPNVVVTPEELAESVWGSQSPKVMHSLGVHMRTLRTKLSTGNPTAPRLVTRRGLGYELVASEQRRSGVGRSSAS